MYAAAGEEICAGMAARSAAVQLIEDLANSSRADSRNNNLVSFMSYGKQEPACCWVKLHRD